MRVLLAIPHYYFATENNARDVSLDASKQDNRLRVFEKMLSSLYPNWMADEMLFFQNTEHFMVTPKPIHLDTYRPCTHLPLRVFRYWAGHH